MPTPIGLRSALFAAFLLLPLGAGGGASQTIAARGVVVEDVGANSGGERAGIKSGDVLLAWTREASPPVNPSKAGGDLASPFDLDDIEMEEAPRGPVTVVGIRNGGHFSAALPSGEWKISTRPHLPEALLAVYEEGRRLIAANELERGMKAWKEGVARAEDPVTSYWILLKGADKLADARRWKEAAVAYREAMDHGRNLDQPTMLAPGWERAGAALQRSNDWSGAEAAYRQALQLREQRSPASLGVAHDLHLLGVLAWSRGDRASAGPLYQRSLEIRTRLAPESLPVATSLNQLGILAAERGDLAEAEELFTRSLRTRERLVPGSLDLAGSLSALGVVATRRGDLVAAEELHRRSLAIKERLAPGSLSVAVTLNGLGVVAWHRGDLAAAEDFYRRSLAIHESVAPGGTQVGTILQNLGGVARQRGDLALAQDMVQRALAIKEKLAPESLDVAAACSDLGVIALDRGDLRLAHDFHTRAHALRQQLAPGTLHEALSLTNLGEVAQVGGDLARAREFHTRALGIREKIAPRSLDVATSLSSLGRVAEADDNPQIAEQLYTRALGLYRTLAPGSTAEARTLYGLGSISRRSRAAEAARYFGLAIEALESQAGRLGGAQETRSDFAAGHADYYRDYVEVLVSLDQASRAFEVLERSRARSLLAMLAERDLSFASDIPPELERERKRLAREYDQAQATIARLNPTKNASDIDRSLARLRELRDQREATAQRIRQASPRLAALQYPRPLDVARTRQTLDPGTVLLSYSVGHHETMLFVVQPVQPLVAKAPALSIFRIPIGAEPLRDQVAAFRSLIQRPNGPGESGALEAHGRKLFDTLVKPAEALVARASRVLISADGPLHTLPFGALVLPGAKPRYFIEWKPLHSVISATVYEELRRGRRPEPASGRPTVIAFADPSYPVIDREDPASIPNADLRAIVRSGYRLEPLPASRREVAAITDLFGSRAVSHVGPAATEERAKTIGRTVRYVHFATHGLIDEQSPLNSGLALTIPPTPIDGAENGVLQAWEIFEQVRLDADLVTLSSCESALGKESGGEGLVSLTRAFQYAGARAVLASLWSVADDSTAELMTQFYGYLRAGKTKDVALQRAQIDLIRSRRGSGGELSNPFHWAAFTLNGDWK